MSTTSAAESFEDFVAQQGQHLLAVAYLVTHDAHDAQDLAQAALLEACRKWSMVVAADDQVRYVTKILMNCYLQHRRRRSSGEIPTADGEIYGPAPCSDFAEETTDRLDLRVALQGLPPQARAVVVLRFFCDLSHEEIGDVLGLAPSSVRAASSRAVGTLRHAMSRSSERTHS